MLIYHRGLCPSDSSSSAHLVGVLWFGLFPCIYWWLFNGSLSPICAIFMRWANSFISSNLISGADYDAANPLVFFPPKISVCFLSSWTWTGLWLLKINQVLREWCYANTRPCYEDWWLYWSLYVPNNHIWLTCYRKCMESLELFWVKAQFSSAIPNKVTLHVLGSPGPDQIQLHRKIAQALILPKFLT